MLSQRLKNILKSIDNLTADLLSIDIPIRQQIVEKLTNADPELGR